MSIAGINGYNYSNYYTGTKRNTAKANGMNSGLLSNVSSTSSNINYICREQKIVEMH